MNTPNKLALSRILLSPIIFGLYVNRDLFPGASTAVLDFFTALLFTIACITDFLDGYLARKHGEITLLGEILDPLADKLLMLAAFLGLSYLGRIDPWIVFIIISREMLVTGIRIAAAGHKIPVAATFSGKTKTVAQMFAVGFLTMQWPGGSLLLWGALILTIISGYEVVSDFRKKISKTS